MGSHLCKKKKKPATPKKVFEFPFEFYYYLNFLPSSFLLLPPIRFDQVVSVLLVSILPLAVRDNLVPDFRVTVLALGPDPPLRTLRRLPTHNVRLCGYAAMCPYGWVVALRSLHHMTRSVIICGGGGAGRTSAEQKRFVVR